MLELRPLAAYHGPNPVAAGAVVVAEMVAPEGSLAALQQAIPALVSATADWYRHEEATPVSDPARAVGEFLAGWALQALTFVEGYLHDAGAATDPGSGRALVWVGFHEPDLSLATLQLAGRWLAALADGSDDEESFQETLEAIWNGCRQHHPDYQARIIMEAARARAIPYAPAWGRPRFWRFGQGERSRVLFESSSSDEGRYGSWIAQSKYLTKAFLTSLGLPHPTFRLVHSEDELADAVAAVGFPCVTKPLDQGGGRGVSSGLLDLAAVRQGFAAARTFSAGPVMVEAHVEGEDHRLMVVDGRLVGAFRRVPPTVTGDGRRTIAELVDALNSGRDGRSLVASGYLRPIALDASAQLHLAGLGLSPNTVPAEGQVIRVRSNSNLSTGGSCVDVTEQVHPHLRVMAETIARSGSLTMLGADFLTTDLSRSPVDSGGQFVEINTTPGLEIIVTAGWPVERVGSLALGDQTASIPISLIVVPDDAVPDVIAIAQARTWPAGSGWASRARAANSGAELAVESDRPWSGLQALLGHRNLARALVIAGAQQIYDHGLPLDAFESGLVVRDLAPLWVPVLQRCCSRVQWLDDWRDGPADWLDSEFG